VTLRPLHVAIMSMLTMACLMPARAEAACAPLSLCSCTTTATGVSFGGYDPTTSRASTTTGNIQVHCTLLVAIAGSFAIDLSTGVSSSYSGRALKSGASSLRYNLFTDNSFSQIWGNGTGGSANVSQSFSGLLLVDSTSTIYGRIDPGQNVPAGTYSDTIVVTVSY
jgi:spore coat protein U-like protein